MDMASTAYETYRALPSTGQVYSDYDLGIIADILRSAEGSAGHAAFVGAGTGEVTLQRLLKSYEQVLPRYNVRPDEDIYYYRFLLKLSLDPNPDWWAKLQREMDARRSCLSQNNDDSRELLQRLNDMLDSGNRQRPLPGPANATPLSVSVTLLRLVPRTQSSGSLFAPTEDPRRVDALVDRINARFGYNKVYFGGMQLALEHDAAPMRIPFNRIPDSSAENESTAAGDASQNALWLQSLNRFKVLAEGEHRKLDRKRKGD
ncbi:MAG: hypothetical protein WDW38_007939 [Sanguina aurantia]